MEPPTKRTRAGTKAKARAALAEAFVTNILARRARDLTTWPKPRAAIALDVYLANGSRGGARVDNICKWLLDELAGHVYADDRQVKMLFARVSRPTGLRPLRKDDNEPGSVTKEFYDEFERLFMAMRDVPARAPELYITAQPRANVLADLRAASELVEERWDPFDAEYGLRRKDPIYATFERDELMDYRAMFGTESDDGLRRRRQLANQIDYHDQSQQQAAVDLIFSSLFTDLPVDRYGIWGRVRNQLTYTPYIFDIGALPDRGESVAFKDRFRALLEERREAWPGLFPMRARSGISLILFEDPANGKALDNLMLTVLPDILEVLRPQQDDLPGWIADETDPLDGVSDIPFTEIAAFPSRLSDMPPGSVIFGLSTADRYESWWSLAADHLERVLEAEEDKGWW
ncbi:hypothetical protein ACNPNP_00040 [Microbacterium sp. AGC85]